MSEQQLRLPIIQGNGRHTPAVHLLPRAWALGLTALELHYEADVPQKLGFARYCYRLAIFDGQTRGARRIELHVGERWQGQGVETALTHDELLHWMMALGAHVQTVEQPNAVEAKVYALITDALERLFV